MSSGEATILVQQLLLIMTWLIWHVQHLDSFTLHARNKWHSYHVVVYNQAKFTLEKLHMQDNCNSVSSKLRWHKTKCAWRVAHMEWHKDVQHSSKWWHKLAICVNSPLWNIRLLNKISGCWCSTMVAVKNTGVINQKNIVVLSRIPFHHPCTKWYVQVALQQDSTRLCLVQTTVC